MIGRQQSWLCSGSIDEKKKVDAIIVAKPTLKGLGVGRSFKGGEGR
jgi:hypothetical protein